MSRLLFVLGLAAFQDSRVFPASAPASRPASMPSAIAVGQPLEVQLPTLPKDGLALRLDVTIAEPLTIFAESCDADVDLRVEDEAQSTLASDDDSATETDAWLSWTPTAPGHYVVRLLAKEPAAGVAFVQALRGSLDPRTPEPPLAAIAYWDSALDRARARKDEPRVALALSRLAALEGRADAGAALAARIDRDAAVAAARGLLRDAKAAERAKDLARARALVANALSKLAKLGPSAGDALLASVAREAGIIAYRLSDLHRALEASSRVREHRERTLPPDHPDLQEARQSFAVTIRALGHLPSARSLLERVVEVRERTLPPDHRDLQVARLNLAVPLKMLGENAAARALEDLVLEVFERTLSPDDPLLQKVRLNLAMTLMALGELVEARALEERALEVRERTLPPDDPALQNARQNLAITVRALGDLARARELFESVLQARERELLPDFPDHPDLLAARLNFAVTIKDLGDLAGARELLERVLEVRERTLPREHTELLATRLDLAGTMKEMGDLTGARALLERVLEVREHTLPPDHVEIQETLLILAATMQDMGEFATALALEERVVRVFERTLSPDNPTLLTARQNLAATLYALEDFAGAKALEERVLKVRELTLPPGHPEIQAVRLNLAAAMKALGDLAEARALEERAVEVLRETLPPDHPRLQIARENLSTTLASLSATEELGAVLESLALGGIRRVQGARCLSSREAMEVGLAMQSPLEKALSFAPLADRTHALDGLVLRWIETRRAAGSLGGGATFAGAEDPELQRLRGALLEARRKTADLASGAAANASRPSAGSLAESVRARDRAERDVFEALARRGLEPLEVDAAAIAARLPAGSAAVGYLRYTHSMLDPKRPGYANSVESLLAHVIRSDGSFERLELAPIDAVERAVERWREVVGTPLEARGVGGLASASASSDLEARKAGETLRALVLDPVLSAAGDARTLYVCLDDALQLVPLDALPGGEGPLGERITIQVETSFARLLRPRGPSSLAPSLLAVGGVDYQGEGEARAVAYRASGAAAPPLARGGVSEEGRLFPSLPGTRRESEEIARRFRERFGAAPVVLAERAASKERFAEAAPMARYLHLATHGFFSDAAVKVQGEDDKGLAAGSWRGMSFESTVKGMSPLTLCGLALAGASRGMDSLGRVPGILTAEELAGIDLRKCDLAVLSACETKVGIGRAGMGIHSLQSALGAAGVRTAITALWRVPDERTCELMADFYRRLWIEKKPAATALWESKGAARKKGWPIRDWAGWILSGDPGDEPAATRPASRPTTAHAGAPR